MNLEDRAVIESGQYFKIEFSGGYFIANKVFFTSEGLILHFRGSVVGYVSFKRIKEVSDFGSSVTIEI